jgi:hypothetical protein
LSGIATQHISGPGDHVVLHLPVHIRNPQTGDPCKKNILKKDKLILVVLKIVVYLYSIMRRYKDQKLFSKKNKNN